MENNMSCKPASKKNFRIWIIPIIVVIALGILLLISKSLLFKVYDVPGKSMVPTINPGDKIVTTRINNTNNIMITIHKPFCCIIYKIRYIKNLISVNRSRDFATFHFAHIAPAISLRSATSSPFK